MDNFDMQMPDEERKRRAWLALAIGSAGLLGAPKGREWQAVGQGLQQGLLSYGDAQSQWQRGQQDKLKMQMAQEQFQAQQEERQMRLAEAKRAQEQQQAHQRAAQGAFVGGAPQMGPPTQQGEMQPAVAPQFSPQAYIQSLYQQGLPQEAIAASQKYAPAQKEIKETRTLMQNGKRVTVNIYKDGSHEVLPYDPDAEKAHFANNGARVGIPLDPFTGMPRGQGIAATVSPDTQFTGNITMRGQNMTDARARESTASAAGGKVNDLVATVRKEFNALDEVKNFKAVVPMLESARKAPDTPAGDLDLIYAVGKVLDPGSVVREGELGLVIKSGTPMEQFAGYVRAIGAGKGRLPPAQRAKLVAMLEGRVGELGAGYQRSKALYERQARAAGLPAEQIFADVPDTTPTPAPAAAGALSPQEQAELDALRKRFGNR